jgi:hypothetical protein
LRYERWPLISLRVASTLCFVLDLKVIRHFNLIINCGGAWTLTKLQKCNEEVVAEVDIPIGDDDVGVEKSPKNEKPHEK